MYAMGSVSEDVPQLLCQVHNRVRNGLQHETVLADLPVGKNAKGDTQQRFDVVADAIIRRALTESVPNGILLSEESGEVRFGTNPGAALRSAARHARRMGDVSGGLASAAARHDRHRHLDRRAPQCGASAPGRAVHRAPYAGSDPSASPVAPEPSQRSDRSDAGHPPRASTGGPASPPSAERAVRRGAATPGVGRGRVDPHAATRGHRFPRPRSPAKGNCQHGERACAQHPMMNRPQQVSPHAK